MIISLKSLVIAANLMLTVCTTLFAQEDTVAINSIRKFQQELDAEYKDPKVSPLAPDELKEFRGHDYFQVDLKYRVEATLVVTEKEPYFKMMTSSNQPRNFRQYGILSFMIDGQELKIPVYQSQQLSGTDEYADYLFFPFTDLTNGHTTYSAGRYIDLRIPENGNRITVDFNKAYNPLCAYSDRYACPIVPAKNHVELEIKAGVQYTGKH